MFANRSGFSWLFLGFYVFVLGAWVPAIFLYFARYSGFLWHDHARVSLTVFLPAWSSSMFLPGGTAYLGFRLGSKRRAAGRRYVLHAVAVVVGLVGAEAVTAWLFCLGVAAYSASHGMFGLKSGALTGRVVFATGVHMLYLWLFAALVSCTAGCIMGTAAGAKGCRSPAEPMENGSGRGSGIPTVVIFIMGFAALNVAGVCFYPRVASALLPHIPLMSVLVVLAIVLAGNLWACAATLWFLWRRSFAGTTVWYKWLLAAPLLGLAAFCIWLI